MSEQVPHVDFICDEQRNLGLVPRTISAEGARAQGYADLAAPRRIHAILTATDDCETLLYLAIKERSTPLPAPLYFARELATCALTDYLLATRLGADGTPKVLVDGILDQLLVTAPALTDLSRANLQQLWIRLGMRIGALIVETERPLVDFLSQFDPSWASIGEIQVTIKDDPEVEEEARPFLLMASYINGYSPQNRMRRDWLSSLFMRNYMDRPWLAIPPELKLAFACSPILRRLAESQALMYPTLLSPGEAYALLRDAPAIIACGVMVDVPEWWESRRPPRMELVARVGTRKPSGFGLASLLDFQLSYLIDDVELPATEWARLVAENQDGLVRVGGRWLEVERALVEATARAWKSTEVLAREGLSLSHALAAVRSASAPEPGAPRVSYLAGAWLGELLSAQKAGAQADLDLGAELQATLRPYQREGVAWLALMSEIGAGVCLADDMGLGKTLQVLALILRLRRRGIAGPHLLVVPASLIGNWREEIAAHTPTLSTAVVHHTHAETAIDRADLVLTSYATLVRQPALLAREWPLVVLDEAQTIKNPAAKQTVVIKKLQSRMRIALTGTPVENHLGELWSIFDFLDPGLLGPAKAFKRRTRALGAAPKQTIESLRTVVRPFILRRMKTDPNVIRDLPEKVEVPVFCGLTSLQARLYAQVVHGLETDMQDTDGIRRKGQILAALVHFKQICNHPAQYLKRGEYTPEQSAKFIRLRALCAPLAERGERALVFTQFQEMTRPLATFLATIFGRDGLVLAGNTPVARRARIVADFQRENGPPFMVLTLKVGGTGLNLTSANHVIHFDRWWNPAAENQASDRAFRIGQTRNVMVHKFVCRGTLEQRIDELLRIKQTLADDILCESDTPHITEFGTDELLGIVRLDSAEADDRGDA